MKKIYNNPIEKKSKNSNIYRVSSVHNDLKLNEQINSIIWNRREKFVNLLMEDGKKTKAAKLFFEMLWFLKKRINTHDFSADKNMLKQEYLDKENNSSKFFKSNFNDLSTLYYFSQALQNVMPTLEVRKVRVSGSTYLVPAILYKRRQESLAIKWIIESAKNKQKTSKFSFAQCLADEIYDAFKKQGQARQKRDELHRLALANRAYMRYRWW